MTRSGHTLRFTSLAVACRVLTLTLLLGGAWAGVHAAEDARALIDEAGRLQHANLEASIQVAERALGSLDPAADPELTMRAHLLLCDAWGKSDLSRAGRHLEAGLQLSDTPRHRAWRAAFWVCRGTLTEAAGRIEEALANYDAAAGIAGAEKNDRFLADALFARGRLRTLMGADALALVDLEQARDLFQQLGLEEHTRTVTNSIASLFNRTGDYERAREYYLLSVDQLTRSDMPRDLGVALHGLGRVFENLGDLDSAEDAYRRSLAAQEKTGFGHGIAYARRGLASVLSSRGRPAAALAELDQAGRAFDLGEDARLAALIAQQRGRALVALGRHGEAEPQLRTAIEFFRNAKSLPELDDCYQYFVELLAGTGRLQEALKAEREHKEISDRVLAQQREQLMDIQRRQFTARLDVQQLAALNREKERSQRELAQQNELTRLQWALLAVFVLAVAAIGYAFIGQRDRLRRMREAELRVRQSEERYRLVVEHVGEGMLVVQDERIVYANPKAVEISGYTLDDVRDSGFLAFIHPDDRVRLFENYQQRLRGDAAPESYEARLIHKSGEVRWVALGVTIMPWDGRPATLSFIADITRRKALEEQLHHTLAEREAILDNAIVGMALVDGNFRIVWANARLGAMLGASGEDLCSRAPADFFAAPEVAQAFQEEAGQALAATGMHQGEVELLGPGGQTTFRAQLSGCVLDPEAPARGAVWAVLDVTDRHKAEQEIRDALARQKELNEMKSRFVSITSHEFRTPLATILSAAEILRNYFERLPHAEREEVFDSIEGAVRRMTQMVDNVLVLGKLESSNLRFEPQPADARALCEAVAREVRQAQPEGAGMIETRIELPSVPLRFDGKLVRHILQNLLGNAFKYSPAGSPVEFAARLADDTLRLQVSDHGIGIPAADRPRLFEAFHRAANVGSIPGTGLGLSIVKQAVELHGGRIDVDSAVGRGTTFVITLPVAAEPAAQA